MDLLCQVCGKKLGERESEEKPLQKNSGLVCPEHLIKSDTIEDRITKIEKYIETLGYKLE